MRARQKFKDAMKELPCKCPTTATEEIKYIEAVNRAFDAFIKNVSVEEIRKAQERYWKEKER